MGGYSFPSTVVFGSHVQRSEGGVFEKTEGMCDPQPHQEVFSSSDVNVLVLPKRDWLTASWTGGFETHVLLL
jgi:hypothetical protein